MSSNGNNNNHDRSEHYPPTHQWIIVLVAFDDADVEPRVIKERLEHHEDPKMAAFMRGGELIDVIEADNEELAELERAVFEKKCLR
jgi:hypothetical protein